MSTTNTSIDVITDSTNNVEDHQHQSLMRPHPLHVKVTLMLSRIYFIAKIVFSVYLYLSLRLVSADHTGDLLFTYFPVLNIVTVQGKLSGLKAQQR